ncbi:hypothetical protein [Kitasatospora sp. MAP5-34]|uniref:hypothetical protein n=1 Tax=Kitasatospora sp. MAP5-34 TaxID=3035102 RepID=UPI002473FB4B|nr:hypothetical protein [Kitasatospora sp. MAP5-34]MDH6578800.1 hypothetical protein [Kitasatospora sp. MAP5-34]
MLAQVWGLGIGVTGAYAATGDLGTDLVSRADAPALLDQLTGIAVPLLGRQAAPVGQVLQDRIRAGGLPLPGQAATVPDAFAIAAVLLPSVPTQARGDDAPRASRSAPNGGEGRIATAQTGPAPQPTDTRPDPADPATPQTRPPTPVPAGQPPVTATAGSPDQPGTAQDLALAAETPVDSGDDYTTVLVPIAAGMLLTGAAMYKHRGLPGGH